MNMDINISEMTTDLARLISAWTYDGIYSIYNHSEDFVDECMDGSHFAFTDADGELLGYFCFGAESRIPTIEENVYDDGILDIGLHIRPDLCGRKLGHLFLEASLNHAREKLNATSFRASVASFNKRSINLCIRAGFNTEQEVTHKMSKKSFVILRRDD